MTGDILENEQKNMSFLKRLYDWLTIVKMRLEMENRSHWYVINRPRPRHGNKR